MEKSEPSLVPEWLRTTGNVSGNSGHHHVSAGNSPRNGCSKIGSEKNNLNPPFLDRTSSGNSRYSSSNNGSSKHPYSSFNRNPRNRDREKDKSSNRDPWELDNFDPLGDILISRTEKDALRRSRSLLCSRKPTQQSSPRKLADVKSFGSSNSNNNHSGNNGTLFGGIRGSGARRAAFDKDFPSLGAEEKHVGGDIRRVPSPGVSTGMQSLIGGEGWTSALAEVPAIIGSNLRPISVQHIAPSNASSAVSSPLAGPNMAEALSQGPPRARTPSQIPDKTQMLEELAIKQSKQLIPMTPSMPKGLVLNSDKLKLKTSLRTGEPVVAVKSSQQQQQQPHSPQLINQSVRGGQVRAEATGTPRSSNGGKFLVLKPVRDNGISVGKDVAGATNNASKVATSTPVPASNVKSPNSSKLSHVEGKVSALSLNAGPFGEKRPSISQVQSRSDFFKLMRKKSSAGSSGSSTLVERTAEVVEGAGTVVSPCVTENGSKEVTSNGDSHEEEKNLCLHGTVYPDEEEAAFLRSLGWDENAGEDEGLTEEEINAFYEEYMKMKPSLKLCKDVEQKITSLCESHTTGSSKASSELSFSKTEIEA